jgi:hypothetical protein
VAGPQQHGPITAARKGDGQMTDVVLKGLCLVLLGIATAWLIARLAEEIWWRVEQAKTAVATRSQPPLVPGDDLIECHPARPWNSLDDKQLARYMKDLSKP